MRSNVDKLTHQLVEAQQRTRLLQDHVNELQAQRYGSACACVCVCVRVLHVLTSDKHNGMHSCVLVLMH